MSTMIKYIQSNSQVEKVLDLLFHLTSNAKIKWTHQFKNNLYYVTINGYKFTISENSYQVHKSEDIGIANSIICDYMVTSDQYRNLYDVIVQNTDHEHSEDVHELITTLEKL